MVASEGLAKHAAHDHRSRKGSCQAHGKPEFYLSKTRQTETKKKVAIQVSPFMEFMKSSSEYLESPTHMNGGEGHDFGQVEINASQASLTGNLVCVTHAYPGHDVES